MCTAILYNLYNIDHVYISLVARGNVNPKLSKSITLIRMNGQIMQKRKRNDDGMKWTELKQSDLVEVTVLSDTKCQRAHCKCNFR